MRIKENEPLGLRPIGARALKSARDTLRPYLFEARCLDLFSGRGRFGLAALEEGASWVTFVEAHKKTSELLSKATERYSKNSVVFAIKVEDFLDDALRKGEKFDLIFVDPPFSFWEPAFAEKLFEQVTPLMAPSAIFLVKLPKRMVAFGPIQGLSTWKTSQFGESKLIYLTHAKKTKS